MATNIIFNGVTYPIPVEGDSGWGTVVSNYLIALSTGTLQRSGGSFILTAEVNFGNSFGLKAPYFKSSSTNPSGIGALRLANDESVAWRNAGNTADFSLKVDSSGALIYNGTALSVGGDPVQTEISVSDTSTIDLSLVANDISATVIADSLTNSHINASAAIVYSKLSLSNSIVNADIASAAAIAFSKMAALTASKALVSDGSGVIGTSATTATELGYLSGLTSNIQDQIDNLDLLPSQGGNSGKYLSTNGTLASWQTVDALPSQTGNADKILTTNGTVASWIDNKPPMTVSAVQTLTGGGTVTLAAVPEQRVLVQGTSGVTPIVLPDPTFEGQILYVQGASNANPVEISQGTNILQKEAIFTLQNNDVVTYMARAFDWIYIGGNL